MRALAVIASLLILAGLFVRSYTLPPAPDRPGGTTLMLDWPDRPLFVSPRGECLRLPEPDPVIPCLIASVNRARTGGFARIDLPFCGLCLRLSQSLALWGLDAPTARAREARIARFGW